MRNYFLPVLACVLFSSCTAKIGGNHVISGYGPDKGVVNGSSPLDSIEVVKLDRCVKMSYIHKVEILDTGFLVSTFEGLYYFNRQGKLINEISRRGRSAAEWTRLTTFFYNPEKKNVTIVDSASGKLLHYTLDGIFLEKESVGDMYYEASDVIPTGAGNLICHNVLNDYCDIITLNDKLLYSFKGRSDGISQPAGTHIISEYESSFKIIAPFDNRIYEYNPAKGLVPYCIVKPGVKVLNLRKLKKMTDFSMNSYAELTNNGCFAGYSGIFETDRYLVLNLFNSKLTVFDKTEGTSVNISYVMSSPFSHVPLMGLKSSRGNTLLGVADTFLLKGILSLKGDDCDGEFESFENQIAGIDINDNPYLILYHLKSAG